jgi:hypothetical protein
MTLEAALRAYLSNCAAPVTYAKIASDLGAARLQDVTQALELLMEQDAAANRPFLAALAVSRTRPLPARGFFDKARDLGCVVDDEAGFHLAELAAVIERRNT